MEIDKMLRMNAQQQAEYALTLTAEELRYLMCAWNLSPLPTVATCEAARRYLADNIKK